MSTDAQREAVARVLRRQHLGDDAEIAHCSVEELAGYLARADEIIAAHEAAAWAGDSLTLPEQWAEPIRAADALRFTAEIRQMLDYIDKAIEPPKDPSS